MTRRVGQRELSGPRRGSHAVEFALAVPVLSILVTGIIDYGRFFDQKTVIQEIARDAVRAGVVTPLSDGPVNVATARFQRLADERGFAEPDVSLRVWFDGVAPDRVLRLDATVPYHPLVGLVPAPAGVSASIAMRMEEQS